MTYAPIALFVYKRLWHVQQTVAALQKNAEAVLSDLYIYSDGAKNSHLQEVTEVREWLTQITGFKSINLVLRKENLGLANAIISGVTALVNQFGRVIVVEDDLVVSPYFLKYMNDGLKHYAHEPKIASIHAYALPIKETLPQTYFLRGADCWGWATWKRAWDHFELDGAKLLKRLKQQKLEKEFDFNGTQANIKMLKDQIAGKNNSWAIRWHASAFLENMLTLYPGMSYANNIGLDNSGEHCQALSFLETPLSQEALNIASIPLVKNEQAYQSYVRYFKSLQGTLMQKVFRKMMKVNKFQQCYRALTPPLLQTQIKNIFGKNKGCLKGPYANWQSALNKAAGYQESQILAQCKKATLAVQANNQLFVRDGVVFTTPQYAYPQIAALLKILVENKGKICVLDFGGALGSSYYAFKHFCPPDANIKWCIIEQPNYVACGNTHFSNDSLQFFSEGQTLEKPDVILFSASLQYLEKPYQVLEKILSLKSQYCLFDRTLFHQAKNKPDQILVEQVTKEIIGSSYPFWLLNYEKFIRFLTKDYQLLYDFEALEGKYEVSGFQIISKGFFLKRL